MWSVYNFIFEVKNNNGGNNYNLLSECGKLKNTVQEKKPDKKMIMKSQIVNDKKSIYDYRKTGW